MMPTFREWRELRAADPAFEGELALDVLDPFGAFADLVVSPSERQVTADEVLDAWSQKHRFAVGSNVVIGRGVRDLLKASWSIVWERVRTAWLPADVYPVYREIICGESVRTFATMPALDLGFLDATTDSDLVLLPAPLHPAGKFLSKGEIGTLRDWLLAGESRILIIDTVYDYREELARDLAAIAEIDHCIVLRSMSKAWLCRQQFGCAEFPASLADAVHHQATQPSEQGLRECLAALEADVLGQQRGLLDGAWAKIASICPRPANGYLTTLEGDWRLWRKQGLRVVPASVFGSECDDLSVVSCLGLV